MTEILAAPNFFSSLGPQLDNLDDDKMKTPLNFHQNSPFFVRANV